MMRRVILKLVVTALNIMLLLHIQYLVVEIGDEYMSAEIVVLIDHRYADDIMEFN